MERSLRLDSSARLVCVAHIKVTTPNPKKLDARS